MSKDIFLELDDDFILLNQEDFLVDRHSLLPVFTFVHWMSFIIRNLI